MEREHERPRLGHTCVRSSATSVLLAMTVAGTLAAACTVGPNYKRPEMTPPPAYRHAAETQAATSLADVPWWQVFDDPALQALIRDAIAHNLDLRRRRRARAGGAGAVRRRQVVPLSGDQRDVGYTGNQASRNGQPPGAGPGRRSHLQQHAARRRHVVGSWICSDVFAANDEAAFARYLATEEGRRAVLVTLVSDVASSYFLLRELDLQLEIARRTLKSERGDGHLLHAAARGRRLEPARSWIRRRRTGRSRPRRSRSSSGRSPCSRTRSACWPAVRRARSRAAARSIEQHVPPIDSRRRAGDAARAAARRPPGRAAARRVECRRRRGQGALLPDDQPDRARSAR